MKKLENIKIYNKYLKKTFVYLQQISIIKIFYRYIFSNIYIKASILCFYIIHLLLKSHHQKSQRYDDQFFSGSIKFQAYSNCLRALNPKRTPYLFFL